MSILTSDDADDAYCEDVDNGSPYGDLVAHFRADGVDALFAYSTDFLSDMNGIVFSHLERDNRNKVKAPIILALADGIAHTMHLRFRAEN